MSLNNKESSRTMKVSSKRYNHIITDVKKWTILKFANNSGKHKKAVVDIVFKSITEEKSEEDIKKLILKCAHLELRRIKNNPWKVDPPDEEKFWETLRSSLADTDAEKEKDVILFQLKKIIIRYAEEIFGDFKESTFKLMRVLLTYLFGRIFNGLLKGSLFGLFFKQKFLKNKLRIAGFHEETRELFSKGLVVLLPTHQSNLDSVILGYSIDYKMGLPAFAYGAGLNLYNYEIPAFYMSKLGAYKVDRRKKNYIYMSTLLSYSRYSMTQNVNSIFFPGGTRSRSGEIETNLKTGLMSTIIGAQFDKIKENKGKIFIVPVILNYNSVLEARPLIYSYLKRMGQKDFMKNLKIRNRKNKSLGILISIYKIFTKKSEFVLSFGSPMDVFGNHVDKEGNSYDFNGKLVDIADYFRTQGELIEDTQRNSVYTNILSQKIADSYISNNVVFASTLVAKAGYDTFIETTKSKDIFDLMANSNEETHLELDKFKNSVSTILDNLRKLESNGKIILHEELDLDIDKIVQTGLKNLGIFHKNKVLYLNKQNQIKTEDFGILYYYANRLSFLNKK